jgi:very-short-patch-repair endonuclease
MTLINNKKELESTRKTLRNNQTKGEQLIWSKLK